MLIAEHERQIIDAEVADNPNQRGGRSHHHFLGATDQGVLHLNVAAQAGIAEALELHLASGALGEILGKEFAGAALVTVFRKTVAESNQARLEIGGMAGGDGAGAGDRKRDNQGFSDISHDFSSGVVSETRSTEQ